MQGCQRAAAAGGLQGCAQLGCKKLSAKCLSGGWARGDAARMHPAGCEDAWR